MVCRIAELQYKEVIDISDGTRYGFVEDVELDPEKGAIESIVVGGRSRCFGLLGREPDQVFPWDAVKGKKILRFPETRDKISQHSARERIFRPVPLPGVGGKDDAPGG